jgi:hypothetical protein
MHHPRIGIYTVLAYEDLPDERLRLFRDYCLHSVKAQIYPGFDLFIVSRSDKATPLCGKGSYASDGWIRLLDFGHVTPHLVHAENIPFADYPIQLRMDSDDYLMPNMTAKLLDLYYSTPDPRFLATFNPYIYDHVKGLLHGGITEWSENKPSMFSALFQKETVTDYIRGLGMHCHLNEHVPRTVYIPDGYCAWVRHGQEQFTKGDQFPPTAYTMEARLC